MVVNGRATKRLKRRPTAEVLHDLEEVSPFEGPFRQNVESFLARYAREPPPPSALLPLPPQLRTWRASFRLGHGGEAVDLDVVEEDVARARSVYCDQCRVVGWSDHPVCGKRYHFIIRNDGNLPTPRAHQMCIRCGSQFDASDIRCSNCGYELSAEDMEDWAYRQLEDSTHLLHGVVHTNGYGHLLRVNGREGGSVVLTGSEIMDFWDRLCKMLWVRKISVMDISKKYGLEFRLLHAITTGKTWYGEWGYEFGAGSFASTAEDYHRAVEILSNLGLSKMFLHARGRRSQLHDVITFYWSLSDHRLTTVRDLFCFLLDLIREVTSKNKDMPVANGRAQDDILCAWTIEDVKRVEDVMLKILRAAGVGRWISWRSLRGAACHLQGSTVLIDYCLKGLAGRVTDEGCTVLSRCNDNTNTIEFKLESSLDHPSDQFVNRSLGAIDRDPTPSLCRPSKEQLIRDLRFLFGSVLNPDTMHSYKPSSTRNLVIESARRLLDCKQFVKKYDDAFMERLSPHVRHLWCEVLLLDQPQDYTAPPAELVILQQNATLGGLKIAVSRAFQETYLIFHRFQVDEVIDLGRISDSTTINLLLGDNCTISVKGKCNADHLRLGQFRKERGTENWTVDCSCGAQDDDGERMMACDSCGVWRHTRCMGINDFAEVPKKYICWKCSGPPKVKVPPRRPSIKKSKDSGGEKCESDPNSKAALPLPRVCAKRCREDDSCNDDVASPTESCLTNSNQFNFLTLVG